MRDGHVDCALQRLGVFLVAESICMTKYVRKFNETGLLG